MSLQDIPAGDELLAAYGYKFESSVPWYMELFLKFMEDHPEEKNMIEYVSMGKTRKELEKVYQDFWKFGPPSDDETFTIEEPAEQEGKTEL
jgi:hypothetical protein